MDTCRVEDDINVKIFAAPAPDDVLVEEAKLGDRSAFAELWRRYSNLAFKRIHQMLRNPADAEDVIQEAWMKAYVHLGTFDGRSTFSTWFTRIAINSALMTLRRKRVRRESCMEVMDGETWRLWEVADQTKDIELHFVRQENEQRLKRAICRLKPSLRTVVEIRHRNDATIKETADLAGISTAATKTRLFRAKALLRTALNEHAGQLPRRRIDRRDRRLNSAYASQHHVNRRKTVSELR
jgi:RNA polymerase sigma-70 factor, ECF subfamily